MQQYGTQYLRFENLRLTTTAAPGSRPIGVFILESHRPIDPHHITFSDCEIDHLKHGLTWYEHGHVLERCHIHDNYGIPPETGHTQGIYVSGSDMTIRDNLFVNNGKPDSWFDHNLYHYPGGDILRVEGTDYPTLAAFRIDYPFQEAAGVQGDPLLANPFADFRLTAASVLAIDAGAAQPGIVDDDFDGLPRPLDGDQSGTYEWDIGPHEYVPAIFADGFESGATSAWTIAVP